MKLQKNLLFLTVIASAFILSACQTTTVKNIHDLRTCETDQQCIVVPHKHCCGSTKISINFQHLEYYQNHKNLHTTDDPSICATIGICMDDKDIKSAYCSISKGNNKGTCQLKVK